MSDKGNRKNIKEIISREYSKSCEWEEVKEDERTKHRNNR